MLNPRQVPFQQPEPCFSASTQTLAAGRAPTQCSLLLHNSHFYNVVNIKQNLHLGVHFSSWFQAVSSVGHPLCCVDLYPMYSPPSSHSEHHDCWGGFDQDAVFPWFTYQIIEQSIRNGCYYNECLQSVRHWAQCFLSVISFKPPNSPIGNGIIFT